MSISSQSDDKDMADSSQPRLSARAALISALLVIIGIGAIFSFLVSVQQDDAIQFALNWEASEDFPDQPSIILAFLESFGIIVPALIFYLGSVLIGIGIRLRSGQIRIAHWAKVALLWLMVGSGALILLNLYNIVREVTEDEIVLNAGDVLTAFLPLIIGFIISAILWYWLEKNVEREFHGEDLLIARETRLAWNLLIPTMTIFVLVAARPLEQTFIRSLTDKRFAGTGVPQFVGLDNYAELLGLRVDTVGCRTEDDGSCSTRDNGSVRWESIDRQLLQDGYRTVWNVQMPFGSNQSIAISGRDDDFLLGVGTTLIFSIISVSLELLIGLFMAMVVNSSFRGRGVMRAIMLVPWAIPTVISARLWELILKDTRAGILNKIMLDLNLIDAPQAWLSDAALQLPTAIIVDVWKTAPFMALLLLAGLQTIPKDLYEAASVDGANPVRKFFLITLPLLRPAIAIALVFRTLDALRVFDLFNVLFGRSQLSMATYNFETLVSNQLDGYASAISVIIFFFISIFAFIYVRMLNVETD